MIMCKAGIYCRVRVPRTVSIHHLGSTSCSTSRRERANSGCGSANSGSRARLLSLMGLVDVFVGPVIIIAVKNMPTRLDKHSRGHTGTTQDANAIASRRRDVWNRCWVWMFCTDGMGRALTGLGHHVITTVTDIASAKLQGVLVKRQDRYLSKYFLPFCT